MILLKLASGFVFNPKPVNFNIYRLSLFCRAKKFCRLLAN